MIFNHQRLRLWLARSRIRGVARGIGSRHSKVRSALKHTRSYSRASLLKSVKFQRKSLQSLSDNIQGFRMTSTKRLVCVEARSLDMSYKTTSTIKQNEITHLGREFGRYCSDSSVEIVKMLMTVVLILIHGKTKRFQNYPKLSDKVLMEL